MTMTTQSARVGSQRRSATDTANADVKFYVAPITRSSTGTLPETTILTGAGTSDLSTLAQRLLTGEVSRDEARAQLDAIPGLSERIAQAEADIDRMEAEGR